MEVFSKRQKIYVIWKQIWVHLYQYFWFTVSETVAASDPLDWSVKAQILL